MPVPSSPLFGVRVLYLEDDANDAALARGILEKEFPALSLMRVETREGFADAMRRGDFDLVLSDYTIPGFSGLEALEIALRDRPRVPFLFFSGTIGEERAVEALKRGAADYVLKDRPGRLASAVRKALEEDRRRELGVSADAFALLSRAISHRLNNALSGVLLSLPFIREKLTDPAALKFLANVESAALSCVEATREIERIAEEPRMDSIERFSANAAGGRSRINPDSGLR